MYGVTKRIQMMELHDSFDEDESIHIEKMEVISDEEATDRYNNIRKHYEERNSKWFKPNPSHGTHVLVNKAKKSCVHVVQSTVSTTFRGVG